jgi:hypothetical protein
MTLILALALLAHGSLNVAQQPTQANQGSVQGVVVDEHNKPIKDASVYADNLSMPKPARPDTVLTDAQGQFVLEHVYPGNLVIRAYKDANMYADMFQFGVPSTMPQLELKAGEVYKGIVIRLDKKAASLRLRSFDAGTSAPIKGIEFQMCHADHPGDRMYCITGSVPGDYHLFVPSGVPISISVSAPNHSEWTYQDAAKKPYIALAPGEKRTLTINMQPSGNR